MATRRSAGLLVFRGDGENLEVLLGHMGGPYWAKRNAGAWSIPKGEYDDDEEPVDAARREFAEELGLPAPAGPLLSLGEATQRSGKVVTAWAVRGDLDPADVVPGTFEMEWPPRSGRTESFPELDRVCWFDVTQGAPKLVSGQQVFLDRLLERLTP